MSNEVTIDALQIEIEAESGAAASNLDKLAQSLDRLQSITQRITGGGDGLSKIAKQIMWVILLVIDIGVLYGCVTVNPQIAVIVITSVLALIFIFLLIVAIDRCIKFKKGAELPTISGILKKLPMKKLLIILTAVLAIAAVIVGIVSYNLSAWKRNFEIKYIGYENATYSSDYGIYKYKITNLTSKTYRSVKAIVRVENLYGNFTFEDYIGPFRQHEEVEYKLRWSSVQNAAKKNGVDLSLAHVDVVRLEW